MRDEDHKQNTTKATCSSTGANKTASGKLGDVDVVDSDSDMEDDNNGSLCTLTRYCLFLYLLTLSLFTIYIYRLYAGQSPLE